MNDGEKRGSKMADALILAGMLALLCVLCRLWPILLFMILGLFVAAIFVLLRQDKPQREDTLPALPEPVKEPDRKDLENMAYSLILRRITELVAEDYPGARWVWEMPDAMSRIISGEEAYILLNRAGGYRRAKVLCRNPQVTGIDFCPDREKKTDGQVPADDAQEPGSGGKECPDGKDREEKENYELLAFEWCEAHILALNERCNDAIGQDQKEFLVSREELPVPESWPDICRELGRNGLEHVDSTDDGILITL